MNTQELLKKVRLVEIHTRKLVNQLFSGEYHSVFKGRGMAFSEVREYQYGDDIRSIDWNVSARYDFSKRFEKLFVKVFEEERELSVLLLVDMSKSGEFGTNIQFKNELAAEISAVLSFSAIKNNDKVGLVMFTNQIEKVILPKKGRAHIMRIIRDILGFEPKNNGTNLSSALEFVNSMIKKKTILFILSDFIDEGFEKPLRIARNKHDVIAIRLVDKLEQSIPKVGLLQLRDAETGKVRLVDTSQKYFQMSFTKEMQKREEKLSKIFSQNSIDVITVRTGESYFKPLQQFFKNREKRLAV
ncbi:MAG: DUF58 domain-containing protein [Ignavibacteria bacterium]|nr:DUF58 domain-containing protein [Ignavibacteria bacterium]